MTKKSHQFGYNSWNMTQSHFPELAMPNYYLLQSMACCIRSSSHTSASKGCIQQSAGAAPSIIIRMMNCLLPLQIPPGEMGGWDYFVLFTRNLKLVEQTEKTLCINMWVLFIGKMDFPLMSLFCKGRPSGLSQLTCWRWAATRAQRGRECPHHKQRRLGAGQGASPAPWFQ